MNKYTKPLLNIIEDCKTNLMSFNSAEFLNEKGINFEDLTRDRV